MESDRNTDKYIYTAEINLSACPEWNSKKTDLKEPVFFLLSDIKKYQQKIG